MSEKHGAMRQQHMAASDAYQALQEAEIISRKLTGFRLLKRRLQVLWWHIRYWRQMRRPQQDCQQRNAALGEPQDEYPTPSKEGL